MITKEQINKIKGIFKSSKYNQIRIKEVSICLSISRPTAEKLLLEMEIKGLLKRVEESSNKKSNYSFKYWRLV